MLLPPEWLSPSPTSNPASSERVLSIYCGRKFIAMQQLGGSIYALNQRLGGKLRSQGPVLAQGVGSLAAT